MRELIVIVALLVGCERKSTETPPVPAPRDAVLDGPVDALVDQEKIDALDRLYTYFSTTTRKRSPVEADLGLTNAYRDWMFAYGYARAGKPARARELMTSATAGLSEVADDLVHATLANVFAVRVTAALGGQRSTTALPAAVEARIAALDRIERYKVDRLRESSRITGPPSGIDAIGAFARKVKDYRGTDFEKLQGVVDDDVRTKLLVEIVNSVETVKDEDRGRVLEGVLDEGLRMPPEAARRILEVVVPQIGLVPEAMRGRTYVSAIVLADAVEGTRLGELVPRAGPALARSAASDLAGALEMLVRSIGKTHRTELATIWKAIDTPLDARARAAYAAGLLQLGDPRAAEMLAAIEKAGDPRSLFGQLELSRILVLAYAQGPRGEALAAIDRIARQFPSVTDSFGTNSHYAKTVLELVDMVVVGVVDE